MLWILVVPVLLLAFIAYRKTAVNRILKDARQRYAFSIFHRRVNPSRIMKYSARGRLYFLEQEILNFQEGWFREVEQILVPGSGKSKRTGVLPGNFSQLRSIRIRDGRLEIEAAAGDQPARTWQAELREQESAVLQQWIARYAAGTLA